MHHIVLMKVVDGAEHLFDRLGSVLLGELALVADTIEKFATGSKLGDDVELFLYCQSFKF